MYSRSEDITYTMKWGRKPNSPSVYHSDAVPQTQSVSFNTTISKFALILVHGYCSSEVWPEKDFTNALVFKDLSQSRTHDKFSQLLISFCNSHGLTSFSLIGHSQGGLVAVHTKTYYWTGLDNVAGGRAIQSVGSPYQGCSLAGSLASIGTIFGIGCSSNTDLTVSGCTNWLSGIPKEARAFVYYYTTTYPSSWLASACVTASGLVMKTPNDGTCEIPYSSLTYANNMGNTEKQCHTTGMNYEPQTHDAKRNAVLNANAARS